MLLSGDDGDGRRCILGFKPEAPPQARLRFDVPVVRLVNYSEFKTSFLEAESVAARKKNSRW